MSSSILERLPDHSIVPQEIIDEVEKNVDRVVLRCTDQYFEVDEWLKSVPSEFYDKLRTLSSFAIDSGLLIACDDCLEDSIELLEPYKPLSRSELSKFLFLMKVLYSPFESKIIRNLDNSYSYRSGIGILKSYRRLGYESLLGNEITFNSSPYDYELFFGIDKPYPIRICINDNEVTEITYNEWDLNEYDKYAIDFIMKVMSNIIR